MLAGYTLVAIQSGDGGRALYLLGSGSLTTATPGGTIDVQTLTTFEGTGVNPPTAGSMKAIDSNSSVTVTAIGSGNAQLDVEENGDGNPDSSRIVAWATLEGQGPSLRRTKRPVEPSWARPALIFS